jgi:hypothetical protein
MSRKFSSCQIATGKAAAAIIFALLSLMVTRDAYSQQTGQPAVEKPKTREDRDPEQTASVGEMVVKQQITRRRKEHEELLKRADEALKLSEELEDSLSENETLDSADVTKLESLEKIVGKIRKDLGGDDKEQAFDGRSSKENSARQSIASAFAFLRESTKSLVDELRKTSRFSVSAVAIQTSNSVIRFARFLRQKQ